MNPGNKSVSLVWYWAVLITVGGVSILYFVISGNDKYIVQTPRQYDTDTALQYVLDQLISKLKETQAVSSSNNVTNARHIAETHNLEIPKLPRILCWVLCDPSDLTTKVKYVKETWAKHCDTILYMSSSEDKDFPTIGLDVEPGRGHIASKSKAAWTYIYKHHLYDADYFVKTDPDTFLIVENMKHYLLNYDPEFCEFFGHRLKLPEEIVGESFVYTAGGPGQVLSRAAVRKLVEEAFSDRTTNCMPDGQGEDHKTSRCLISVGCHSVDTRDEEGKETFLVFTPGEHLTGSYPDWYSIFSTHKELKVITSTAINNGPDNMHTLDQRWKMGDVCCSDYPIGMHYIGPKHMVELYFLFYKAKVHGRKTTMSRKSKFKYHHNEENVLLQF